MRRLWWFAALAVALAPAWADDEPICRCALDRTPEAAPFLASAGIEGLDARIASERSFLERLFGVAVPFRLLSEEASPPAFAAREGGIGIQLKLLRERAWERERRHEAVAALLAHFHAHAVQWARDCPRAGIPRELHADLLAGWYLGKRNFGSLAGPRMELAFAASLFDREDPLLNARFEHGSPEARAHALAEGFRLRREENLALDAVYERGLELFPPERVGAAAPAPDAAPAPPGTRLIQVKVPCTHTGPCQHKVPCKHPRPCTHKVACRHEAPCVHKIPCTHRVECKHRVACVHRIPCRHRIACRHTIPCAHRLHDCDFLHEFDRDARGSRIACEHRVPCVHFRHRCDFLHTFDYAHDWDFAHEFDRQHEFDLEHAFDTQHPFDPKHEFDLAHEWDPEHPFDLAHASDALHDYDVALVPAEGG
ncbi:MAG: hypothetical protein ACT4PV_05370 [Planctomycetaceae bacterium]